jgi:anti-sigma B factor antagonist
MAGHAWQRREPTAACLFLRRAQYPTQTRQVDITIMMPGRHRTQGLQPCASSHRHGLPGRRSRPGWLFSNGRLPAVSRDSLPVRWTGQQAVVTVPEHIDVTSAGQIREELLSVINRGATELVADMTATVSCDHAGADAVARAYQRAAASGTQLRLVVPAPVVRRVLGINGLDRLIPIYPSPGRSHRRRGADRGDVSGAHLGGAREFRTGKAPATASWTRGRPQGCGHHRGRAAESPRCPRRRDRAGR